MSSALERAENEIVRLAQEAIDCFLPDQGISVEAGPYEWSEAYIKRLMTKVPSVIVIFEGASVRQRENFLTLDCGFSLIVLTGWKGETQAARRLGDTGAYAITEILAAELHSVQIRPQDEPTDPDSPRTNIGIAFVDAIENLTSAAEERIGLAVYMLGLDVDMPVEPRETPTKPLDEFLRAGMTWDIPDGQDIDLPDLIDVRTPP